MNAEKEKELFELLGQIKANCEPCRKEVAKHTLILDGPPGNTGNPGLTTRVSLMEQNQKALLKMRDESRQGLRLSRATLLAVILAVLGALGIRANDYVNGTESPPPNPAPVESIIDSNTGERI